MPSFPLSLHDSRLKPTYCSLNFVPSNGIPVSSVIVTMAIYTLRDRAAHTPTVKSRVLLFAFLCFQFICSIRFRVKRPVRSLHAFALRYAGGNHGSAIPTITAGHLLPRTSFTRRPVGCPCGQRTRPGRCCATKFGRTTGLPCSTLHIKDGLGSASPPGVPYLRERSDATLYRLPHHFGPGLSAPLAR